MMRPIILGTRGSALALRQAEIVSEALRAVLPGIDIAVNTIRTEGDRRQDVSLEDIGGQGVFVNDIERRLTAGEIDIAVHSLKDMPAETPIGFTIGAVLPRADVRDALVGRHGADLHGLPDGATIGTDSRRRSVQLVSLRPDLRPTSIRGNVDTRLRKVDTGEYDAAVLALAGLERLGLALRATQVFDIDTVLPAVGQGCLAIEARAEDIEVLEALHLLDDRVTRVAITAERAFLRRLGAGCRLPVGAYATVEAGNVYLRGLLANDAGRIARGEVRGADIDANDLGYELADRLLAETTQPASRKRR